MHDRICRRVPGKCLGLGGHASAKQAKTEITTRAMLKPQDLWTVPRETASIRTVQQEGMHLRTRKIDGHATTCTQKCSGDVHASKHEKKKLLPKQGKKDYATCFSISRIQSRKIVLVLPRRWWPATAPKWGPCSWQHPGNHEHAGASQRNPSPSHRQLGCRRSPGQGSASPPLWCDCRRWRRNAFFW